MHQMIGEELNRKIIDNITDSLKRKYGADFAVTHIGDRWNTPRARAFVHPKSCPDIVFTAFSGIEGKVDDDFIAHLAGRRTEQTLTEALGRRGIRAEASFAVLCAPDPDDTDTHISPSEYAGKYQNGDLLINLAVCADGLKAEELLNAAADAQRQLGCLLVIDGHVFDRERFARCASGIAGVPEFGRSAMRDMGPMSGFRFMVNSAGASVNARELTEQLKRRG